MTSDMRTRWLSLRRDMIAPTLARRKPPGPSVRSRVSSESMLRIVTESTVIAVLVLIGLAAPAGSQAEGQGPETVIRALVMAIYGHDVAGYDKLTIPHPLRARLTERGRVNQAKLDALKENPEGLQIIASTAADIARARDRAGRKG